MLFDVGVLGAPKKIEIVVRWPMLNDTIKVINFWGWFFTCKGFWQDYSPHDGFVEGNI